MFDIGLNCKALLFNPSIVACLLDHLIRPHKPLVGIVWPICFAVFRFITRSNFMGFCTGRSTGFALFQDFVHG